MVDNIFYNWRLGLCLPRSLELAGKEEAMKIMAYLLMTLAGFGQLGRAFGRYVYTNHWVRSSYVICNLEMPIQTGAPFESFDRHLEIFRRLHHTHTHTMASSGRVETVQLFLEIVAQRYQHRRHCRYLWWINAGEDDIEAIGYNKGARLASWRYHNIWNWGHEDRWCAQFKTSNDQALLSKGKCKLAFAW